jgi:hypothetical protein
VFSGIFGIDLIDFVACDGSKLPSSVRVTAVEMQDWGLGTPEGID